MKIKVKLPEKSKIVVEHGQKVDFNTPLAHTAQKRMIFIPIAEMMNFQPQQIFRYIKHAIGDQVHKGDILAENTSFFSTRQYLSEVSGVLREIKHDSGIIAIEQNQEENTTMNCFFIGEVDGIYDGYLELKVEDVHTTKLQEEAPYFGALIYYLDPSITYSDEDLEGVCVFAPEFNELDSIKMEALGAQGLITRTKFSSNGLLHQIILQDEKDFDHIKKKGYPYVLIGHEPMTVIFYK